MLPYTLRSTAVTMTSKVNGKTGFLTPVDLKNPWKFYYKIVNFDFWKQAIF